MSRLRTLVFLWLVGVFAGCDRHGGASRDVVIYCAQDQVYAEPIFRKFEEESGYKVKAVFDSEAVKTVGLANRLLAEKGRPQADVFWGNEEMRARQLERENVFRQTNGLHVFGYRSRRLVVNTNALDRIPLPASLLELTNTIWKGKVALAYPLFGTTSTHFHALRQHWGGAVWENWCRALAANEPLLLEGNSGVVKAVGAGRAWIGLTDSDDIEVGLAQGFPVAALPWNQETLLIPNSVGLVRGGPNPEAAERAAAFLKSQVETLVDQNALEGARLPSNIGIRVNWPSLLNDMPQTTRFLEATFLK